MMDAASSVKGDSVYRVIVTGANSGLGYAICTRLIDTFLQTRAATQTLELLPTARSTAKAAATAQRLREHLRTAARRTAHAASEPGDDAPRLLAARVRIREDAIVDLCSIASVQRLARKLKDEAGASHDGGDGSGRIDAVVCNAGMGGWVGVDWLRATWAILTNCAHATTYPEFKLASVGSVTRPQRPEWKQSESNGDDMPAGDGEPPLGEVFCANVFGHYLLVRDLMPLLCASASTGVRARGRVVWLSSTEAYEHAFSLNDFQALRSTQAYESTKRLTDVLALTAHLPGPQEYVGKYMASDESTDQAQQGQEVQKEQRNWPDGNGESSDVATPERPRFYLAHPGICATAIFPLPYVLLLGMQAVFYVARWLGSPWHTIAPYKGAAAPVWATLAPQAELDVAERDGRRGKWGSSTDRRGNVRVVRTDVEGWGWSGAVGEQGPLKDKGRWKGARNVSQADRIEFEELGTACWREMERLREEWGERVERHNMQ